MAQYGSKSSTSRSIGTSTFHQTRGGLHSSTSSTAYLHGLLWKAVTPKTNTMARQIVAIPFSSKGSCLSDFIMLPSWNKRLCWTMHCWIWQCSSCESGFENRKNHAGNVHPLMWDSLKVSMWTFQPHPGLDVSGVPCAGNDPTRRPENIENSRGPKIPRDDISGLYHDLYLNHSPWCSVSVERKKKLEREGLNIYGQERDAANNFPRLQDKPFHQSICKRLQHTGSTSTDAAFPNTWRPMTH